jgi:hypothetical protein
MAWAKMIFWMKCRGKKNAPLGWARIIDCTDERGEGSPLFATVLVSFAGKRREMEMVSVAAQSRCRGLSG